MKIDVHECKIFMNATRGYACTKCGNPPTSKYFTATDSAPRGEEDIRVVEIPIHLTPDEVRTMLNCILAGEMGFAEMNLFHKLSTQLTGGWKDE